MISCLSFDDISPNFLSLTKFDRFLNYLNNLNVNSTLFVVPKMVEGNNCFKKDVFSGLLKLASQSGHEIAQHGYEHAGNEIISEFGSLFPFPFYTYEKQKKRIELGMKNIKNMIGKKPKGFRAPFYLHNLLTFKALSNLGFNYDSSKTLFKPAYYNFLRIRVMRNIQPFKINNVLEIPVTGDYTYNIIKYNPTTLLKLAIKDFKYVKRHNGVFVINNHPNYINLNILFTFLDKLIKKISSETNFMTLNNVNRL